MKTYPSQKVSLTAETARNALVGPVMFEAMAYLNA
jgi:hypothetical protein